MKRLSSCFAWALLHATTFSFATTSDLRSLVQSHLRTTDAPMFCQGRLTLTSGTPITTSDVTAAQTIYFSPYNGSQISLYTGSRWQVFRFTEKSVAVPATTTTPFDVFLYDNSGTLTLETVDWTNDTTRATSLTNQNGVWVKTGSTGRRYLGTARTTGSSGQTEDSVSKRFLWNACNRIPKKLLARPTAGSWQYTAASWRSANNDTTTGQTRVELVVGQSAEPLNVEITNPYVSNPISWSSIFVSVGVGVNATGVNSASLYGGGVVDDHTVHAIYRGIPNVGFSYVQWMEISEATNTTTWFGNGSSNGISWQPALVGESWQ